MKKNIILAMLSILLIIMNTGFIAVTIKNQQSYEIIYNILTVSLNIIYYILELMPGETNNQ